MTIQVDNNGQPLVAALQFPVYRLSEFDWKNWTPASRFYYTQFIGIDDTATPVVYSLRYCIPGVTGGVGQVSSNTLEDFQAEIADVLARQDRIDLDVADLLAQVNSLLTTAQDVAAQAQSSVTSSAQSATSASDSATKAQTWAEGEDAAVVELGGVHSSKGWASEAESHATAAHNDYISMTTDANVVAVGSNINNVNAVGQSISNVNTVAGDLSVVNNVASNINDINTVAGISGDVSTVAGNNANINTVATNIADVNTTATNIVAIQDAPAAATNAANSATASANSATASATSANNSHIWAEGTDAQVQALGGVHSSKGWAEQSTNANISLTNSPYTTNRILEIPQDIKLELNDGTLTLKAGSKLYVPNGFEADGTTPKFDEVNISVDKTGLEWFSTSTPKNQMVFVGKDGLGIDSTVYTSSGTSYPSSPSNGDRCYRTDLNLLYTFRASNNQWNLEDCLPIAIVQPSSTEAGKTSSIDQVFNGFGYIGSTVFALPGVKIQAPNGKNADGTCRSIIATVDSVKTKTITGSPTANMKFYLSSNLSLFLSDRWSFDADKNMYVSSLGVVSAVEIAYGYLTSGKITSFEPYTVDSVANSNLSNLSAAGQAKFDAKANAAQFQVVSALPANPDPNVFYFIPEA